MPTTDRTDDRHWRLGGLSAEYVDVLVQSRSDAADFWDGNWLGCRVDVVAGGSRFRCGISLRAEELAQFCAALDALSAGSVADATFTTLEEQLELRLHRTFTGQLEVEGVVLDQPADGNRLEFRLALDQSYLLESVAQLERLVRRFPVRGAASDASGEAST